MYSPSHCVGTKREQQRRSVNYINRIAVEWRKNVCLLKRERKRNEIIPISSYTSSIGRIRKNMWDLYPSVNVPFLRTSHEHALRVYVLATCIKYIYTLCTMWTLLLAQHAYPFAPYTAPNATCCEDLGPILNTTEQVMAKSAHTFLPVHLCTAPASGEIRSFAKTEKCNLSENALLKVKRRNSIRCSLNMGKNRGGKVPL